MRRCRYHNSFLDEIFIEIILEIQQWNINQAAASHILRRRGMFAYEQNASILAIIAWMDRLSIDLFFVPRLLKAREPDVAGFVWIRSDGKLGGLLSAAK
jgi:hypothetical protein